jgi:hypothetical protein
VSLDGAPLAIAATLRILTIKVAEGTTFPDL